MRYDEIVIDEGMANPFYGIRLWESIDRESVYIDLLEWQKDKYQKAEWSNNMVVAYQWAYKTSSMEDALEIANIIKEKKNPKEFMASYANKSNQPHPPEGTVYISENLKEFDTEENVVFDRVKQYYK